MEKLKDKIIEYKNENRKLTPYEIYVILYFSLRKTVVHELQHAYDDYRSSGHAYQTKEFKKYLEKYPEGTASARECPSHSNSVENWHLALTGLGCTTLGEASSRGSRPSPSRSRTTVRVALFPE